jgi:PAS domain S-box-containing protein
MDEVHSSKTLLADLLDRAPDGVVIVDDKGRIMLVNEQTERLFGYPRDELLGERVEKLLPDAVRHRHGAHRAGYTAAPTTREMGVGLNLAGLRKDGTEFPVDISLSAVETPNGRLVTAFVRDTTERRRTEAALAVAHDRALEASRLKSEFVANMSHEIRTPLNGVIGLSELLLQTQLSDEQREYVDGVSASGAALMTLIDDILDFSKIEAGKLELDPHVFDLRDLVDGVASMLAPSASQKDLELIVWVDEALAPAVRGDSTRIRQVLTNLGTNAVKFTETGEIVVRVAPEPGSGPHAIAFTVSDTGIGIESDALERIFDSFSQADSSTTREFGGTGLGLAISRQLTELMAGELDVTSTPGAGSTFRFIVNLPAARSQQRNGEGRDFRGARALVVDANATNRAILAEQLQRWGFTCERADGPLAALASLQSAADIGRPYDVVLLDQSMPGVDGTDLAALIKHDSGLGGVRVVLLTASGGERDAGRRAGVDGFLTKPIRRTRLEEELARVLGAAQAARPWPADRDPQQRTASGGGRPVLVAEDNLINQLVAVRMLEARGFSVDVAVNGSEAVAMAQRRPYAMVFMDCQMPELDGFAATAQIRRDEAGTRRVPIIAMTANVLAGDRERCLAAGMDDYLGKPLDAARLDDAIGRALATQAQSDPVIVDRSRLADVFADAHERGEVLELFVTRTRTAIADIAQAYADADVVAVARLAHGLKGSSATVGAVTLAALADRARERAAAGDLAEPAELCAALETALDGTAAAFASTV